MVTSFSFLAWRCPSSSLSFTFNPTWSVSLERAWCLVLLLEQELADRMADHLGRRKLMLADMVIIGAGASTSALAKGKRLQITVPRLCDGSDAAVWESLWSAECTSIKHLAEQDYIVFEAGTHTDAIKMSFSDYDKIVKPKVEDLAIKFQPIKGA